MKPELKAAIVEVLNAATEVLESKATRAATERSRVRLRQAAQNLRISLETQECGETVLG